MGIKNLFQNKIVKIVAWVLLAVSAIALIIGGVTAETISSGAALVSGIVTAAGALVAFIAGQISSGQK